MLILKSEPSLVEIHLTPANGGHQCV